MNYGTVSYRDNCWVIECEPQVRTRLKRMFPRAPQHAATQIKLSASAENTRELEWFLQRYPMEVDRIDLLEQLAEQHREVEVQLAKFMTGHRPPEHIGLAIPPREYQLIAAQLLEIKHGYLLADDLGLGKTVSAICGMVKPANLPVLVVCQAHLPRQWQKMIKRFAPALSSHILKKGTPYDLTPKRRGGKAPDPVAQTMPDVIITSYHKLRGWADTLAGVVRYVVFDECQQLRSPHTEIYHAANHVASQAARRLGLSATPIYNYGHEFHHVINVLAPGALGEYNEFLREWCVAEYGGKARLQNAQEFGAYLRREGIMLRRTRAEVGRELPALTKIVHEVEADQAALNQLKSDAVALAKIVLRHNEQYRGQKMQAAGEFDAMMRQATGIAKAPYVAEFVKLLLDSGEPIVLYGWHRACFARGTMAMMLDGSTKAVEDVAVGDVLMGPDSKPRTVKNLTRGQGAMFKITPNKGASWVCSEHHILVVHNANNGKVEKWTAGEFIKKSTRWRRSRLLFRANLIEFPESAPMVEPWLMGYWLGDGAAALNDLRVSSADREVLDEMKAIAQRHQLDVSVWESKGASGQSLCKQIAFTSGMTGPKSRNRLLRHFVGTGLKGRKRIPGAYMRASVEDRRQLLAGLLDSDGHVFGGNSVGSAAYTSTDRGLADEVATLARSLGLAAYVSRKRRAGGYGGEGCYFSVNISGDLTALPMRIGRKQARCRAGQKSVLRTGFDIEQVENAEFFGFEVDGDHLFLLDDFTVVHNCYDIWLEALAEFKPVLYTGSESAAQKEEAINAFLAGESRVLIMSLRSGAGVDGLQGYCRTVVFGELDWSPGVHEQCIGRVHRDGQDDPCAAYFLISESGADPIIADVLGVKREQIESVRNPDEALVERIDTGENNIRRLAREFLARRGEALPEASNVIALGAQQTAEAAV